MGRSKLKIQRLELKDFSKGYFANQDFDSVPDGGSSDCKHVIWKKSALRKLPGMDLINSSAAATTRGSGIFYFNVSGTTKRVAVFGSGFYEDVSGTWTARTGAITLTDGASNHVQFINHQQGANKYLIGVNGVNAPFKWTGAGNAAVLGGSPPANFSTIAKYHDTIFGASAELVYFSDTGDPETWNSTNWVLSFDKSVTCLIENGQTLAVLMEDHIGSINGYDYLDLAVEESEVKGVGCVGRLAATKAFYGPERTEVIATLSKNGLWIIDQAYGAQQIFGENWFDEFNAANLSKATLAYSEIDHLLYIALPYGSATENDYLIVVDMISGAVWPGPSIHANYIRAMASARDDNGNEFVYFVDTAGFAFKFNLDTTNYHTGTTTQAIDARWKSKKIDLNDVHSLREASMLADADGAWSVTMAVGFGLTSDDGEENEISLIDSGDLLGSSFVLGASTLGGSAYVFEVLSGVGGFGRFITVTVTNSDLSEPFNIKKIELQLKRRRMGSVDK